LKNNTNIQSIDALFVGFESQENLGLRSITALLEKEGFHTALEPYKPGDPSNVINAVKKYAPRLIGFSIIFQFTLNKFAELVAILRKTGVVAHFTVGGHFPSLRPKEVLDALPQVDSVVRFEGEFTVVELLRKLYQPELWHSIDGLAFRRGSEIVLNTPRELISDLDSLPPPTRSRPHFLTRGIRVASMLASRGCLYNCSFCSIRQFYGSPPGRLKRSRKPEAVAAEMQDLYEHWGVTFFNFQDDDFSAKSPEQRRWVEAFLKVLKKSCLSERVKWKISCRVDDVDKDLFVRYRDHGLIAVYLGVESGNPTGLKTLNKYVTVEQNLEAIETLKEIGLAFNMGFMLFDPDSTIETVQKNIDFLRQVTGDGTCPVNFCKMLPYAGTPIEKRLQKEGRLKGTLSQPDYDFLDPRLDWYALFTATVFRFHNFDPLGLVERLGTALFDKVLLQAFEDTPWVKEYEKALQELTAQANAVALETLEKGLRFVASRDVDTLKAGWSLLGYLANKEWRVEIEIQKKLDRVLKAYNPDLLRSFTKEYSRRFG
jgi:radical SAM superfamily enzyme YgiQ (UPF0313 family)